MPSSDDRRRGRFALALDRRAAGTAVLTLILTGLLLAVNLAGRLPIRDSQGLERVAPIVSLWRAIFRNLPREAPALLGSGPLLIGVMASSVACAYLIAATLRLPE